MIATVKPAVRPPSASSQITAAATESYEQALTALGSGVAGLSGSAAAERLARYGPNAIVTHGAHALAVLWGQVRSPLLGLLALAAAISYFVGDRSDAIIIAAIVAPRCTDAWRL